MKPLLYKAKGVEHNLMKKVVNSKDEERKAFMKSCWESYQSSGDVSCLVKAVEAAPFFGEAEMAKEIARFLRTK